MSDKVTHEQALEVVSLWAVDQHTNAHLEAQRAGRDLLRAYITQQQASESASSDTVSGAAQASPSPAVGEDDDADDLPPICRDCGLLEVDEPSVTKRPDGMNRCNDCERNRVRAARVQASLSPQVAQASAVCSRCSKPESDGIHYLDGPTIQSSAHKFEPAQPVPGGTELCPSCGSDAMADIEGPLLESGCCRDAWHKQPADPNPAEPQGAWKPQLHDVVRFKDTPAGSRWYTVRCVDGSDRTALVLCNDDNQAIPAWHSWDQLEPAEPQGRPETERERQLIGLMRDVCEEVDLPEEKGERTPILEALNQAYNFGAQGRPEQAGDRKWPWLTTPVDVLRFQRDTLPDDEEVWAQCIRFYGAAIQLVGGEHTITNARARYDVAMRLAELFSLEQT